MIAIVDYQAGNVASVKKALQAVGTASAVTADPQAIAGAAKIILPGVGHFSATRALDPVRGAIKDAIGRGVPFLGICVGMQWMFEGSAEAPETRGLGLLSGICERFDTGVKTPHVGWNTVRPLHPSRLLQGVEPSFFYYTHSYRAPAGAECVATTEYGGEFAAVVEKGNAYGVQFHPEKSGEAGLRLLRNFLHVD